MGDGLLRRTVAECWWLLRSGAWRRPGGLAIEDAHDLEMLRAEWRDCFDWLHPMDFCWLCGGKTRRWWREIPCECSAAPACDLYGMGLCDGTTTDEGLPCTCPIAAPRTPSHVGGRDG